MQINLVNQMLISTECILVDDNREYGTGILIPSISDEYDFVFTALHCLKGKEYNEDNKFKLFSECFGSIECIEELVYSIKELDIAIVKVKKLFRDKWIDIVGGKEGETGFFIGFPQSNNINRNQIQKIKIEFVSDSKIKVQNGEVHLGRAKPVEVFAGFSGSPVLVEKYNSIYLSGIVIKLCDSKFYFKNITYISLKNFYKIIEDNNLVQIRNASANIIEVCISKVFVSEEPEEIYSSLYDYAKKLSRLKIDYFIDWLEQKMFLPYGQYPTSNENVWIGWIKFLTFMYIISEDNFLDNTKRSFDEVRFLDYIKKCRDEGIKYFHSYECNTFPDLLPVLYSNYDVYKDLNSGDAVIANFGRQNPMKSFIPRNEIANVVKNIACLDDELIKNDMDITFPSVNKSLDIVHIYHFEKEIFKNWNYETGARELKRIIKRSTEGVIRSVKGL